MIEGERKTAGKKESEGERNTAGEEESEGKRRGAYEISGKLKHERERESMRYRA